MASCPKCFKQVPDEALHCGYCGAALRTAPAAEAPKRTMFGYAGMKAPAPSRPQPSAPAPAQVQPGAREPQPAGLPGRTGPQVRAARPTRPEEVARTQFGAMDQLGQTLADDGGAVAELVREETARPKRGTAPLAGAPGALPMTIMRQGMPAPAALRRSQPHEAQPRQPLPARTPASAEVPATLFAQAPAAVEPARPLVPRTVAAMPQVSGSALPATATGDSQAAPLPATRYGTDEREPSRPVLASESLAADRAPTQPGRTLMRILMGVGGLLLLGLFAMPVGEVAGKLRFGWDLLPNLKGLQLALQLCVGASGVLFLTAALLPLPFLGRAVVGSVLGLGAVGLQIATALPSWRAMATLAVCFLLPAALLHRGRYRDSILARVLVAACVLTVLAVLLIPADAGVPLLQTFVALGAAQWTAIFPLLLLLLGLLSLLAFLGSGSTGLVQVWAVGLLLFLPVQIWVAALPQPAWQAITLLGSGLALLTYLSLSALALSQIMAVAGRPARS